MFCHQGECQASIVHLFLSRSDGLETGCSPTLVGWPKCLCLPTIHSSSKTGLVENNVFAKFLHDPGRTALATKGVVRRSSGFFGGRTSRIPYAVKLSGSASHEKVHGDLGSLHLYTRRPSDLSARQALLRRLQRSSL